MNKDISIQLWSLNKDCANNLESTLKAVSSFGYKGVELAGLYNKSTEEWLSLLRNNNLSITSAHLGFSEFKKDKINETLDTYEALGCKKLIIPYLDGNLRDTVEHLENFCDELKEIASYAAKRDFKIGYHNHEFEFTLLDGESIMDRMIKNLSNHIFFQFDIGWLYFSKIDGVSFLENHLNVTVSIHIKPYKADNPKPYVCEDDVPWENIIKAISSKDIDVIIEHEEYDDTPLNCVARDFKNLHSLIASI